MGLLHVVAPIFEVRALEWEPPDVNAVDCIMLTSANAARLAGNDMEPFLTLPCFVVGSATAAAASGAGFRNVVSGESDGEAVLEMIAAAGHQRPLHLAGRDHVAATHPRLTVLRRAVYASEAVSDLPPAIRDAAETGAVALLHSPRAAAEFGRLLDAEGLDRSKLIVASISQAAAAAAGSGWRRVEAADRPSDEALLELAAKLCKTAASETRNGG